MSKYEDFQIRKTGRSTISGLQEITEFLGFVMPVVLVSVTLSEDGGKSSDALQHGPTFTSRFDREALFLNTKGVVIPCSAYGRPAPEIDWIWSSGREVERVSGLLELLPNGSLYFQPFRDELFSDKIHSGRVRCQAKNAVGVIVSTEIYIKAVLVSRYQVYNVQVNDAYVTINNTAILQCSVNPYYLQTYVVVTSWVQNGKTINTDGRYSMITSGDLHVRNVTAEDSYNAYRCVTRNLLTDEEKTSDPAHLIVVESVNSSPVLKNSITSIMATRGSLVELPCVANAVPLPQYFWSKDGTSVSAKQNYPSLRGGNLVISEVSVGDSGNYVCTVENRLGKTSLTVRLEVTEPLVAYLDPSKLTVDMGDQALFQCIILGHPVKVIEWYKDGVAIVGDGAQVSVAANGTRLLIKNVQRQNVGMYQCMVINEFDSVQGCGQLSLGAAKPFIFQHSETDYTQVGQRASLSCTTTGSPPPDFHWTVDDIPVIGSARVRVDSYVTTSGNVVGHLNITSMTLEDGGTYRCIAENGFGNDFRESQLNVYGIPYVRPMTNLTAVANERLVLPCRVTGYPVHSITWFKGNTRLPINHRQYVEANGSLTIEAIDRSYDAGVYLCDARDASGGGMNRSVYVHVMDPPRIDPFLFPRRKQGDRVSVSCAMSSGDLPMVVLWLKDGAEIPQDLGISIQKTGAYSSLLSISYVDPNHSGNYTCVARNSAASANHTALLHVDVPPRWINEPENSYVVLGHSVVIDCWTDGDPVPTNTWKRDVDGQRGYYKALGLDVSSDGGRIQQLANGSLWIQRAEHSDRGYYLCQASNGVGPDLSKVIQLTVHIPARFEISEKNYTARVDEGVVMECIAEGDQPISIAWSYNYEDWQDKSRMQTTFFNTDFGRGSKLLISPVIRDDTGFYVCTAQNAFGDDILTLQLVVTERPDPPKDLAVSEGGSRSHKLCWDIGFDGNTPVTSYLVQVKYETHAWEDPWAVNVQVNGGEHCVTVARLKPAVAYQARVTATNEVGSGRPSKTISFTTAEAEPSAAPTDITVTATGSQSLRITWKPPPDESTNGRIIGYYVGYKKNNSSAPYLYITKESQTSCDLKTLEKYTEYAVHIQAFNSAGAGPRSDDVVALTCEDVPSQSPEGIQAVALSSQSLKVSWSPPPLYTLHGILQGYKVIYKLVRDDEDETDTMSYLTNKLTVTLLGLRKYTNYSVQVMAFTRMGEGTASPPIHVMTHEDIPDMPSDIKAIAAGSDRVLVSWKPPLHTNGFITKYTVYVRDITSGQVENQKVDVDPSVQSYMVANLSLYFQYAFRVSASTAVGSSELTREVAASTVDIVSARIASFSSTVYTHWYDTISLPCLAVGVPKPKLTWKKRGMLVEAGSSGRLVLDNGTLILSNIQSLDAADYVCRAENEHGADEITISVIVQAPPQPPVLSVTMTTSTSIQVSWRTGSNGGSRIQGFSLYIRREHADWTSVQLGPNNRSYVGDNLMCGSRYAFYVRAFNRMGEGVPSNTVHSKTNGSTPIIPAQSLILSHVNSTFVTLALDSWQTVECPVLSYDVLYQFYGDSEWHIVQQFIWPNTTTYTVELHPETWYVLKITAHSSAGSTECILKFGTKSYFGATIEPLRLVHRFETPFYENIYIMVPLAIISISFIVMVVAVGLYCYRRHLRKRHQALGVSKLRQDPKTAISLLCDAEKPIPADAEKHRGAQTYVAAPGLNTNTLKLVPQMSVDAKDNDDDEAVFRERTRCAEGPDEPIGVRVEEDGNAQDGSDDDMQISPYATFPISAKESSRLAGKSNVNLDGTLHSTDTFPDPVVLPPPPRELLDYFPKHQYQNVPRSLGLNMGSPITHPQYSKATQSQSNRSSQPPPPPIRRTLPSTRGTPTQNLSLGGNTDDYLPPATCAVSPRILAHEEALTVSETSNYIGQEKMPSDAADNLAEESYALPVCEETATEPVDRH